MALVVKLIESLHFYEIAHRELYVMAVPLGQRKCWVVFHKVLWLACYNSLYLLMTYPYAWTQRVVCLHMITYYIVKLTEYPMPTYYRTTYSS